MGLGRCGLCVEVQQLCILPGNGTRPWCCVSGRLYFEKKGLEQKTSTGPFQANPLTL